MLKVGIIKAYFDLLSTNGRPIRSKRSNEITFKIKKVFHKEIIFFFLKFKK